MASSDGNRRTAHPTDYDTDIARFLTNQAATKSYSTAGDVHERVAERLHGYGLTAPVLDLGGGNGTLARRLHQLGVETVVLDQAEYIRSAPRPAVRADAMHLPLRAGSFGAVAALWMMYHLANPGACLRAVETVLRPGGILVTCAPSRYNDPEFSSVLPRWGEPSTFDAEDAVAITGQVFELVSVQRWDAPLVSLPDPAAVITFLRGRGLDSRAAKERAQQFATPMTVTKRGVLIWGRRR
jgi:SAM-dependent methyltransferase